MKSQIEIEVNLHLCQAISDIYGACRSTELLLPSDDLVYPAHGMAFVKAAHDRIEIEMKNLSDFAKILMSYYKICKNDVILRQLIHHEIN